MTAHRLALFVIVAAFVGVIVYITVRPDDFDERLRVLTAIVTGIGAFALIINLMFTSETVKTSQRTLELARRTEASTRHAKAVEQLGDESETVQLGGLYTLRSLFIDSEVDREAAFSTVQTFVSEVAMPPVDEHIKPNSWKKRGAPIALRGVGIIADMALQQQRQRVSDRFEVPRHTSRYEMCDFNQCKLTSGRFTNAFFYNACFVNSRFVGVEFDHVRFMEARLDDMMFLLCTCRNVKFDRAYLVGTWFSSPHGLYTMRLLDLHQMGVGRTD